ncbi:MAG: three-Cys-motif partner protein TcmP [bacterium]
MWIFRTKNESLEIPQNINIKTECICGKFADVITSLLNSANKNPAPIIPAFIFIDPFGFTGIPFDLIKRIMENEKCEVLITFMFEEINRFIGDEKLWNSLEKTFGTDIWKQTINERDSKKRMEQLHSIYKEQLEKNAGIKYVLSFKMINESNRTDYFLFFGTNNITGLKKMKEAMWKVDASGSFQFSDVGHNEPVLFEEGPDYHQLKKMICKEFKGKSVSIDKLENFILTQTPFRETHYKRQILGPMEKLQPPEIKIECRGERRKGTFPPDCVINFL